MKVLLTGANGFVGSHLLDALRARDIATAVWLRPGANLDFISDHLPGLEIRTGTLDDLPALAAAMADATHVVHCAGCTKAVGSDAFFAVNQAGTRQVVAAANRQSGRIQRLLHISSLAAAGPAVAGRPGRESDPPQPVSDYGRSKLAGEDEVRRGSRCEHVILRPPAVYGPRDAEFLRLFRAVKCHLSPRLGRQPLSFVFVRDLAEVAVSLLAHPAAAGKTFNVASPEIASPDLLARAVAARMKTWTVPLPVPLAAQWALCWAQEGLSRLTGKPNVLNRQKYDELRAPGWVCDPGLLQRETGLRCETTLDPGLARTLGWYREERWL